MEVSHYTENVHFLLKVMNVRKVQFILITNSNKICLMSPLFPVIYVNAC